MKRTKSFTAFYNAAYILALQRFQLRKFSCSMSSFKTSEIIRTYIPTFFPISVEFSSIITMVS